MADPTIIVLYIILTLLVLILFFYLYWKLWFCRKPKRIIPKDGIIAPANGVIGVVRKFTSNVNVKKWNQAQVNILGSDVANKGWFVLIVMNPLNVHVQRAPLAGKVLGAKYTKGKFFNAVLGAQSLESLRNEKNEILLQTKNGKIKIVQIAGMIARRIECHVKKGQNVDKGEEIGFINLGSQVALLLPENVNISVKEGEIVYDGESILGKFT